jgi:ribonuclease J
MKKISFEIKKIIEEYLYKNDKINKNQLKKIIVDFITPKIYDLTLRNPIIIPIILTV